MLAEAQPRAGPRLSFRRQDIAAVADFSGYDLVFSNAALQWVPEAEAVVLRVLSRLQSGAQVALQVPRRNGNPLNGLAGEVARQPPFSGLLRPPQRRGGVLSLLEYSQLLYDHGFREQVCIEKVYGHELPDIDAVVEFLKGTGLNPYLSQLDAAGQAAFLAAFRARLIQTVGNRTPYFYQLPRLLIWGRKDGAA